jgi:hypothetical protein
MSSASQPSVELLIAEMKEFGTFHKKTQRYIRQSLDVAFRRGDPIAVWGRTEEERTISGCRFTITICCWTGCRTRLDRAGGWTSAMSSISIGPITSLAVFDLSNGCLQRLRSVPLPLRAPVRR